jgi:hypothetical protein
MLSTNTLFLSNYTSYSSYSLTNPSNLSYPALIGPWHKSNKIRVIVDLGVIGNYISPKYIKKYHIKTYNKEKPYKLALADGSPVR